MKTKRESKMMELYFYYTNDLKTTDRKQHIHFQYI